MTNQRFISFFGNSTIKFPETADPGKMLCSTVSYDFKSLQSLVKDRIICCARNGAVWAIRCRRHMEMLRNPAS